MWFSDVLLRLDPGLGCLGALPEVVALVAGFTISCDRIGSTRASKSQEHQSFAVRCRTVASRWLAFQRNADVHGPDGRLAEGSFMAVSVHLWVTNDRLFTLQCRLSNQRDEERNGSDALSQRSQSNG